MGTATPKNKKAIAISIALFQKSALAFIALYLTNPANKVSCQFKK